ncbi:MAG TPA: RNA polymerase sigma factor [Thermoanaerobaculia bacterium]|nr:RNA polymerase sigma factor [Thermoanaerobaculia bacterium]
METGNAIVGEILAVEELSDEEVVRRVRDGDAELFAKLIRRYDQRVYRCARAVLANDAEAEDVTQEAWVRAYQHLGQFAGRARFSTWLTRIALHEAFARSRRGRKLMSLDEDPSRKEELLRNDPDSTTPEKETLGRELRVLLEEAIESLPETYRIVFMLREVEGLDTAEAAEALGLTEDAVKTRLSRARALLRRDLTARAGRGIAGTFPFLGRRCDRMVETVMRRIRAAAPREFPSG